MSNVSEKLLQVAQNNPKVYHSGQLNIVKNAECLKASESDSAILIDDVSPVTHEMGVKVRGKNLFNISSSRGFESVYSGFTNTINGNELVTICNVPSRVGYLELGDFSIGTYTLSINDTATLGKAITKGSDLSNMTVLVNSAVTNTITFSLSEDNKIWLRISLYQGTFSFSNIQIELGTSATAYTPYIPDLTAVKVSRCGKNLFDKSISFTDTNHYASVGGGYKKFKLYVGIGTAVTVSLSKKYTSEDGKLGYLVVYSNQTLDKDGKWLFNEVNASMNNKEANLISTDGYISLKIDYIAYKSFKDELQIELGTTATNYKPYITPTEYTPTADGTVNGVESLYPSTTLLTNDPYGKVYIDCDYYKDIDKAFNELTTSVALSGGDM